MDDLTVLRGGTRSDDYVEKNAGRLEPLGAFILWGIVWFSCGLIFMIAFASIAVSLAYSALGSRSETPSWLVGSGVIGGAVIGLAIVGLLFPRRVKRRRDRARAFFRNATVIDVVIERSVRVTLRGVPQTFALMRLKDGDQDRTMGVYVSGEPAGFEKGAVRPLLFDSGAKYCGAFDASGKLLFGRLAGKRAQPQA